MSAYEELVATLEEGETVEAVVFGDWGWAGSTPEELGYNEPESRPVPPSARRRIMPFEEAKQYMTDWSFVGGFGHPTCYAVHVWTDRRVIWVSEYDGATDLASAPRHPSTDAPGMSS